MIKYWPLQEKHFKFCRFLPQSSQGSVVTHTVLSLWTYNFADEQIKLCYTSFCASL